MITLLKIEKSVNNFYFLVRECPEDVKKDLEEFSLHARILHEIVTLYNNELKNAYSKVSKDYESLSKKQEKCFFGKLVLLLRKRKLLRVLSAHEDLIKDSNELKEKMDWVDMRLKQFKIFS